MKNTIIKIKHGNIFQFYEIIKTKNKLWSLVNINTNLEWGLSVNTKEELLKNIKKELDEIGTEYQIIKLCVLPNNTWQGLRVFYYDSPSTSDKEYNKEFVRLYSSITELITEKPHSRLNISEIKEVKSNMIERFNCIFILKDKYVDKLNL